LRQNVIIHDQNQVMLQIRLRSLSLLSKHDKPALIPFKDCPTHSPGWPAKPPRFRGKSFATPGQSHSAFQPCADRIMGAIMNRTTSHGPYGKVWLVGAGPGDPTC
jgi:hypothetical protein